MCSETAAVQRVRLHCLAVSQWLGLNKTCPICNKEVTGTPAAPAGAAAADAADTAVATQ
jgi:hypothetical protein